MKNWLSLIAIALISINMWAMEEWTLQDDGSPVVQEQLKQTKQEISKKIKEIEKIIEYGDFYLEYHYGKCDPDKLPADKKVDMHGIEKRIFECETIIKELAEASKSGDLRVMDKCLKKAHEKFPSKPLSPL